MPEGPDGTLLRRLRISAGITLADLAVSARLGVRTIGDIERGVGRRPQRATLEALADALGAAPTERGAILRIGRASNATASAAPAVVEDFTGRGDEIRRLLDRLRRARRCPARHGRAAGPGRRAHAARADGARRVR